MRRTYRLAAVDLPARASGLTDLRWSGSGWETTHLTPAALARQVRLRVARARLPRPPEDEDEARRQARTILAAASDPTRRRR